MYPSWDTKTTTENLQKQTPACTPVSLRSHNPVTVNLSLTGQTVLLHSLVDSPSLGCYGDRIGIPPELQCPIVPQQPDYECSNPGFCQSQFSITQWCMFNIHVPSVGCACVCVCVCAAKGNVLSVLLSFHHKIQNKSLWKFPMKWLSSRRAAVVINETVISSWRNV